MKKTIKIIIPLFSILIICFGLYNMKSILSVEFLGINDIIKNKEFNISKVEKVEPKVKNEILFLVMGVDVENNGDHVRNGVRSDTMFLCKANSDTGQVTLLNFPRDTRVPVRGKLDKLNHSHAYGGSPLVMQTIRDFTGLDIQYYVKVDYSIVKDVVDSIGGVTINVPKRMKYDDPTAQPPLHIDFQPGEQKLSGNDAIKFLRWRKNNHGVGYEDGDLGRIKTQQYFMKELAKQAVTPSNILNIGKLAQSYYKNVDTNIPMIEILGLLSKYNKFDLDNIKMETIQGNPKRINGLSYYIPDMDWLKNKINNDYSEYKLDDTM